MLEVSPIITATTGHPCFSDGLLAGDDVLVTTIHQAKGREWDVVIVGSLTERDMESDRVGRNLAGYGFYSGEPEDLI